jgi:hypothetical protein
MTQSLTTVVVRPQVWKNGTSQAVIQTRPAKNRQAVGATEAAIEGEEEGVEVEVTVDVDVEARVGEAVQPFVVRHVVRVWLRLSSNSRKKALHLCGSYDSTHKVPVPGRKRK